MNPAAAYAHWRTPLRLAEYPALSPTLSELEWQARWFAGQFPSQLQTVEGERVEIVHRGVWNREPGPDFCEAVIRIGTGAPVRGSIELDLQRRDWETHGHSTNPTFNNVVLHLFVEPGQGEFFTRTAESRYVPQARLELAGDALLPAYPPLAITGRCSAPLATLAASQREEIISAAAHYRLTRKAATFARLEACLDWDEALFQSLATALGYKGNKLPFQILAQRIGLATLRRDPENAEALLFGCAGFLDTPSLHDFPHDTRSYLRSLWDRWWAIREKWSRLILPKSTWKLTGARPANHPQRRLAALAWIVAHWKLVAQAFREAELGKIEAVFSSLKHDFWEKHYTLTSRPTAASVALLGRSRAVEMLVNVAIPAIFATQPDAWRKLAGVRQPLENRTLKTGVLRLYGAGDLPGPQNVLQQQGVLQIYEDFCLRDLTDCARCPFPEKVQNWPT